jgi:hypothetical protein
LVASACPEGGLSLLFADISWKKVLEDESFCVLER